MDIDTEAGAAAAAPAAEPAAPAAADADAILPYVGHRRRLPPDAELFEWGNLEREMLSRQVR